MSLKSSLCLSMCSLHRPRNQGNKGVIKLEAAGANEYCKNEKVFRSRSRDTDGILPECRLAHELDFCAARVITCMVIILKQCHGMALEMVWWGQDYTLCGNNRYGGVNSFEAHTKGFGSSLGGACGCPDSTGCSFSSMTKQLADCCWAHHDLLFTFARSSK
jgi:hypothetical protein